MYLHPYMCLYHGVFIEAMGQTHLNCTYCLMNLINNSKPDRNRQLLGFSWRHIISYYIRCTYIKPFGLLFHNADPTEATQTRYVIQSMLLPVCVVAKSVSLLYESSFQAIFSELIFRFIFSLFRDIGNESSRSFAQKEFSFLKFYISKHFLHTCQEES